MVFASESPAFVFGLIVAGIWSIVVLLRQLSLESRLSTLENEFFKLRASLRRSAREESSRSTPVPLVVEEVPESEADEPSEVSAHEDGDEGAWAGAEEENDEEETRDDARDDEELLVGARGPMASRSAPPPLRRRSRPEPQRQQQDIESWLGRRAMPLVGALVLLAGIAFFLKYAYDNDWIGPAGRLAIGALAGATCLVIGEAAARRKFGAWAEIVSGLGFAVWYVCIYFALEIYELWSHDLAFVAVVGVTIAAVALALRRGSWPLMAFSLFGGYLSPVLLSHFLESPEVYLGWIVILSAAGLFTASWKGWSVMAFQAFVGSALCFWPFRGHAPFQPDLSALVVFHGLCLLLFGILPYASAFRGRKMPDIGQQWVAFVGVTLAVLGLSEAVEGSDLRLGIPLVVLASLLAAAFGLARRIRPQDKDLICALGCHGAVVALTGLGSLVGLHFSALLYAATAAALARRSRSTPGAQVLTLSSFLSASLGVLLALHRQYFAAESGWLAVVNPGFLLSMVTAACLFIGSVEATRLRPSASAPIKELATILSFFALMTFGLALQLEIVRIGSDDGGGRMLLSREVTVLYLQALSWTLIALGLCLTARRTGATNIARLSVFPLLMIGLIFLARLEVFVTGQTDPSWGTLGLRSFTGVLLAAVLYLLADVLDREQESSRPPTAGDLLRAVIPAGLTIMLLFDIGACVRLVGGDPLDMMRCRLLLWSCLLPLWAILNRRHRACCSSNALSLLQGIALVFFLVAAFAIWGTGQRPLLNLDIALRVLFAAAITASAVIAPSSRQQGWDRLTQLAPQVLIAVSMATDIWRWSGTSTAELIFLGPVSRQLGTGLISAVWSLHAFALTAVGFYWRRPELRRMGLAFFSVVLAKVVFIDTGSLPRVHRILSFVATGILMLLGSYLYQRLSKLTDEASSETPTGT